MATKVHFSTGNDEWATPADIYRDLHAEFNFDFDPCPMGAEFDGLSIDWGLRSFCNPPYSKLKKWVQKAYEQWRTGRLVVLLIPSRTDTSAWHDYILPHAKEIRFIRGRLKFGAGNGRAPFPSCVVVFNGD